MRHAGHPTAGRSFRHETPGKQYSAPSSVQDPCLTALGTGSFVFRTLTRPWPAPRFTRGHLPQGSPWACTFPLHAQVTPVTGAELADTLRQQTRGGVHVAIVPAPAGDPGSASHMSALPIEVRSRPSTSAVVADTDPALERGLEALAFLERSRALAAEPVVALQSPCASDTAPGAHVSPSSV